MFDYDRFEITDVFLSIVSHHHAPILVKDFTFDLAVEITLTYYTASLTK